MPSPVSAALAETVVRYAAVLKDPPAGAPATVPRCLPVGESGLTVAALAGNRRGSRDKCESEELGELHRCGPDVGVYQIVVFEGFLVESRDGESRVLRRKWVERVQGEATEGII